MKESIVVDIVANVAGNPKPNVIGNSCLTFASATCSQGLLFTVLENWFDVPKLCDGIAPPFYDDDKWIKVLTIFKVSTRRHQPCHTSAN